MDSVIHKYDNALLIWINQQDLFKNVDYYFLARNGQKYYWILCDHGLYEINYEWCGRNLNISTKNVCYWSYFKVIGRYQDPTKFIANGDILYHFKFVRKLTDYDNRAVNIKITLYEDKTIEELINIISEPYNKFHVEHAIRQYVETFDIQEI